METHKDKVTRRRYDLSKDGATLHVEVSPVDFGAKTEELTFVREGGACGAAKPI